MHYYNDIIMAKDSDRIVIVPENPNLKRNFKLLCYILGTTMNKLGEALITRYVSEHKDKLSSITPDV